MSASDVESYPEVDGAAYMPKVNKISMVSIWRKAIDEPQKLRVYISIRQKCRSPSTGAGRGKVKIWVMKFPTALQAQDELAGLYEAPTDIYGLIGISERGKARTWSRLHCKEALSGKV